MSDPVKISDEHRRRSAVVYVRQSTPAQLERNHESRARQYALRERAIELGWAPSSVAVVDEDLGRSGASAEGRTGFKELAAAVGLGEVGLVLALEVSRLARSSADWHQLLDLCALTSTLIADADGIYSPADFNDRLLLGLKGTMSEAELHLIRNRLEGGRRNKARRGELELNLPVGLDRDAEGRIVLAADEQVRHAIGRVFELWRRLGSARQVMGELVAKGQKLPRRTVGQQRVRWARPSYSAVHAMLTNPAYAGTFAFGRTRAEKKLDRDGRVCVREVAVPLERWSVCIVDHHPGYVSWSEYLDTRERLGANARPRGEGGGAAREGAALLQGLVRCGRCGRRMQVAYSGRDGNVPRYTCVRGRDAHAAGSACQSLGGARLDQAVADAFLEAVTPAAARASALAIDQLERQHEERLGGLRLAVERAAFEAERARRQFDACEPEHRLVARTLEARLEQALGSLEIERRKLCEADQRRPTPLSADEHKALTLLARELPTLWDAESTTARDRKELLRTLIAEVVVTVHREPRRAELEVIWEGGARSQLLVALRRRGPETTRTPEDTVELLRRLAAHHPDRQIAAILNKQGRRTGTGLEFTQARVRALRQRAGIAPAPPTDPEAELHTVTGAARELGVSDGTIYRWLRAGLLPGEQITPHAPWRIRVTDEIRRRFVPEVPDGFMPLAEAAKALGVARQTVLHRVQRGELDAVEVTTGRRHGLRIRVSGPEAGLFEQSR